MPRAFSMGASLTLNGEIVSSSESHNYTCRDSAIVTIRNTVFNEDVWNRILAVAPKERAEELRQQRRNSSSAGDAFRQVITATYLRNQHLFQHRVTLRVSGLNAEAVAYAAGKLQQKYTSVQFEIDATPITLPFGRKGENCTLILTGDAYVVPAWWWSALLLRMSVHNTTWKDVTTLIKKTNDVSDGIGPAGRESTLDAWNACVNRREPAGFYYLMAPCGPVQALSPNSYATVARDITLVNAQARNYAFDLTPADRRPKRIDVPSRGKKAQESAETVSADDAPVSIAA